MIVVHEEKIGENEICWSRSKKKKTDLVAIFELQAIGGPTNF
jgi:hypothetical protein